MPDIPIVRQISRLGVVPQVVTLLLVIIVGELLSPTYGAFLGAIVYLTYSFGSRVLIMQDHRRGIALIKRGKFEEAIPEFERSLQFLDRHTWIDNARSIILMSASKASYREMALANIGFCYSQIGRGNESRVAYERCLERFPNSGLAATALRMINSAQSK